MRRSALEMGFVVFMTGCFHWAPVTSLSEIADDRVQVSTDTQATVTLEHATAAGRVVRGQEADTGHTLEMDVSHARVVVRRLHVAPTAALVAGGTVGAAATVFFVVLFGILLRQQVIQSPPP